VGEFNTPGWLLATLIICLGALFFYWLIFLVPRTYSKTVVIYYCLPEDQGTGASVVMVSGSWWWAVLDIGPPHAVKNQLTLDNEFEVTITDGEVTVFLPNGEYFFGTIERIDKNHLFFLPVIEGTCLEPNWYELASPDTEMAPVVRDMFRPAET
jgi:hypothetical protein